MNSASIAWFIALIAALTTSVTWAMPQLPDDAQQGRDPEQAALAEKGFYLGPYGVFRRLDYPQLLGCVGNFEIQSHRGYPALPENSFSSVVIALTARFNAVEVDARQLGDGTWVLNHDDNTRRTMLTRSSNTELRRMNRDEWMQSTMRNRLGMQIDEKAADLELILAGALQHMTGGQTVNIELKDQRGVSCEDLAALDQMATRVIGNGQVGYSSMNGIKPLQCIREQNPYPYLAVIQGPSRKALENWAAATHGEELSKLNGNRRLMAAAQMATDTFGGYKYPRWSSAAKLAELRRTLGDKVGLHVEITDLKDDPGLALRAKVAGVKLMTYSLTDNDAHLHDLIALKRRGAMPDGAIVDSTPIKTCKMLGME